MPQDEKEPSTEELKARVRELEEKLARQAGPPEVELRSIAGLEQKVIQLNDDLEVEYVNASMAEALRLDREKVKGAPLREIDRFSWGTGYIEVLVDLARAKKEPVSKDRSYYDGARGREVYVRITVTPTPSGPQVVIEDRTEFRGLEDAFRRYVSPQVLEQMKSSGRDFFLPERRSVTVLFADLRGFTAMAERMSPEAVRETVNAFLDRTIAVLQENDATVDKIVGDEVMALFGAPLPYEDHALRAIRAAVEIERAHAALAEEWQARGKEMPPVGVGVNTGEMVVGNIGSEFRTDYTVLGHHVNVAARLCDEARGGEILVSRATFEEAVSFSKELEEQARFEAQRPVEVKGVSEPVEVYSASPREGEEIGVRRLRAADRRKAAPGRRFFGDYELLGEVGRGGMSIVYEATHKDLGRIVALKMLLAGEGATERMIKRFHREAAATARLHHPNVIPIHDVGVAEGHHYFTMDLIDGVTLAELIREFGGPSSSKGSTLAEAIESIASKRSTSATREIEKKEEAPPTEPPEPRRGHPLPVNQTVRIMRDVSRGVQHAHDNGIIHRDVKPSNIMLTRDGRAVVMDFGLARAMDEEGGLTKSGTLVGTIAYMSPEQAEGRVSELDERSDIYSLGTVLYEMLTGSPAFTPTGNEAADAMRIVTEEPAPPRKVNPRLPRELEAIVLKSMEKDRERRYPSAGALADDLERYLSGEPVLAQPPSVVYRLRKKIAKHRAVAGVLAVAVTVAAIGGGYTVYEQRIAAERQRTLEEEKKTAEFKAAQAEVERLRLEEEKRKAEEEKRREEAQKWIVDFEDDFERDELGPNWKSDANPRNKWWIEDGELHAKGPATNIFIVLERDLPGDVRFEYDARSVTEKGAELSCFLSGSTGKGEGEGYFIGFGKGGESKTKMARAGQLIGVSAEVYAQPQETYHIMGERKGARVRLYVDGEGILAWTDPDPLTGKNHDRVGFYTWDAHVVFDNVKVWRLGVPEKSSVMAIADRLRERGHLSAAIDLYEEIAASATTDEAVQEAKYKTALALADTGDTRRAVSFLKKVARVEGSEFAGKAKKAIEELSRPKGTPKRLGQFELLALLGKGAVGDVYRARDTGTGKIVALKVLSAGQAEGDMTPFVCRKCGNRYGFLAPPTAQIPCSCGAMLEATGTSTLGEKLLRLGTTAAQLSHPNLVRVFYAGRIEGYHVLAEEFLTGRNLDSLLDAQGGRLDPKEAVRVAVSMARAMAYVHERKMYFRRVVLDSIHVRHDGITKLRAPPFFELKYAETGLSDVAPESWDQGFDARSDLFCLGRVLYRMLTGRYPWPADKKGPTARLTVLGEKPRTYTIAKEFRIGRLPDNDLQILDITWSRRHAKLLAHRGVFVMVDMRSKNGTWVNGERITAKRLYGSEKIVMGKTKMTFEAPRGTREAKWPSPPPPSQFNPEVPLLLDRVVLKLLAWDPDDRYQTANDFIEDAESLRDRRRVALEKCLGGNKLTYDDLMSDGFLTRYMEAVGEVDAVRALAWLPRSEGEVEQERVAELTRMVARRVGFSQREGLAVELAARLRTLGAMKPNIHFRDFHRWTRAALDRPFIRSHTAMSKDEFDRVLEYAYTSSERPDGQGHPQGLKGDDIPLGGRIICVAVVYNAVVSPRGYREKFQHTQDEAFQVLEGVAGTQLDAEVVPVLINYVLSEPLEQILSRTSDTVLRQALGTTPDDSPADIHMGFIAGLIKRVNRQSRERVIRFLPEAKASVVRELVRKPEDLPPERYRASARAFTSYLRWVAENGPPKGLDAGKRYGRYLVFSLLRAMGLVDIYAGADLRTGESVWLEFLRSNLAQEKEFKKLFNDTTKIQQRLAHPRVVSVVETGEMAGIPFVVYHDPAFETTLTDRMRGRLVSVQKTLPVVRQVLEALGYIHRLGIVHRDVKPSKIVIGDDGAKLAGFHLARKIRPLRDEETGKFAGTPHYASPEQCRGEFLDGKSDIYSLGCTMYHMLTGRTPFEGSAPQEVMKEHVSEELKWPSDLNRLVPEELSEIIAKMMAKDPEKRYQTAEEVLRDLATVEPVRCPLCKAILQTADGARATCPNKECKSGGRIWECGYCRRHTFDASPDLQFCLNPECRMHKVRRENCPSCGKLAVVKWRGRDVCVNRNCPSKKDTVADCFFCKNRSFLSSPGLMFCTKGDCPHLLEEVKACPTCGKRSFVVEEKRCRNRACATYKE